MLRLTAALVATAAIGAPAGTASSTTPVGWTPAKTAALVQADVHIPWCRVYVNWQDSYGAPVCANGKAVTPEARAHEPLSPANVTCTGTLTARGGYRQLRCSWHWNNSPEHGTIQVYVAGPKTFRWKAL